MDLPNINYGILLKLSVLLIKAAEDVLDMQKTLE